MLERIHTLAKHDAGYTRKHQAERLALSGTAGQAGHRRQRQPAIPAGIVKCKHAIDVLREIGGCQSA